METGKHLLKNHKKLDLLSDIEGEWAIALEKCKNHVQLKLKKKTLFGAHTLSRLGENPIHYYVSNAYDAILSGRWEWKDSHTLAEQMILIADSTISTEVEKTKSKTSNHVPIIYDDLEIMFYAQEELSETDKTSEIISNSQVALIEDRIKDDLTLVIFWDCIKEGMKRVDIAAFMEITPKQQDKIRERFINTIKNTITFEIE
jgi:hypothetical protein